MIARARTAKTSQKVNDMLSSVTGTTSMDAFERMKEKVRGRCVCMTKGSALLSRGCNVSPLGGS